MPRRKNVRRRPKRIVRRKRGRRGGRAARRVRSARPSPWAASIYRVNPSPGTRVFTSTRNIVGNYQTAPVGTISNVWTFDPFGALGNNASGGVPSVVLSDFTALRSLFTNYRVNYISLTFRVTGNGTSSDQLWPQLMYVLNTDLDLTVGALNSKILDFPGTKYVALSPSNQNFRVKFRPKVLFASGYNAAGLPQSYYMRPMRNYVDCTRPVELFGFAMYCAYWPPGFNLNCDLAYSVSWKGQM